MNRKKLLIVEDEGVIRTLVQRILSSDYDLAFATGVQEGVQRLGEGGFDLLLSDLRLQDGSGVEVIREFGKAYPHAAILAMTGSLTPEERLAQLPDHRVLTCIQKPFSVQVLQQTVDDALKADGRLQSCPWV